MVTSEQCRAARAVLGWSQGDLSNKSGVSLRAVQDFEGDKRIPNRATQQALLAALERNGIVFHVDGAALSWGQLRGITIDPRNIGMESELE